MIFFQLFNWFQLFSSDKDIPKVAGHSQEQLINYLFFKVDVDGFDYFPE